ncbi:MAG TPA: alpha/beta hydrolase [Thermoanaerobaculia bacterium]|nr:alpha/beta hydrolase [Thermoanaerobaculia bacterium]
MKRASFAVFVVLASSLLAATHATAYEITGTAVSHDRNLVRTEYVVQAGPSPLDKFKMTRLVKDVPQSQLRGSIFFFFPLGTTFAFYEQRDPNGAFGSSIAEYFALRNFDVYGYSPRFEGIPAGTCEAGLFDCTVMKTWDLASMVDDIAFVRSRIEALHPGTRIVAGGASLGGILATAVADDAPDDYDGFILWEGMLNTPDPTVRAMNQDYCAALEAQLAAGASFDSFISIFREVPRQAAVNPHGLTPILLFPPNLTNHQVMVLAFSTPTPGPISMPVPNYIQMNGSLAEDRLFFASEARVFENVVGRFVNYTPHVTTRDISCSLAGVETKYVDNLGAFHGALLAIGGGRGFGPYLDDQLAQFTGTTDKKILLKPAFGHIDHFMTPKHREVVEKPIYEWALEVFGD